MDISQYLRGIGFLAHLVLKHFLNEDYTYSFLPIIQLCILLNEADMIYTWYIICKYMGDKSAGLQTALLRQLDGELLVVVNYCSINGLGPILL